MAKICSVKGIHDVLPSDEILLDQIEQTAQQVLQAYGYLKIRLPILEKTELFKRSIGDATDIVEKEMYSFTDAGGEALSLRPEGTASCVRACLQHGLIGKGQTQRLWYQGPFFRRERPQKGRYRQFYQIGVEAFGYAGPDVDAEQLMLTHLLWERLNIAQDLVLKINTLGSFESRKSYRQALQAYLTEHQNQLDDNARRRIATNPLRVLDSKHPDTRRVIANAPRLHEYLHTDCIADYERLKEILVSVDIAFEEDEYLVRGLDYYSGTVYEWVDPHGEGQNTVCAGGRYDDLVTQLGGTPTPAIGFAVGIERAALMMNAFAGAEDGADVYVAILGEAAEKFVPGFATQLRRELPDLRMITHCGGGSIKTQMRRADKSGARIVLIFGDEEIAKREVTIKFLRDKAEQEQLPLDQLAVRIKEWVC